MANDELLRDCESVLGRDRTKKKRKQVVEFLVNAIVARASGKDVSEKSRYDRSGAERVPLHPCISRK